jgi:hypothetical protein
VSNKGGKKINRRKLNGRIASKENVIIFLQISFKQKSTVFMAKYIIPFSHFNQTSQMNMLLLNRRKESYLLQPIKS